MRLTPVGKVVVLILVIGAAVGIWRLWGDKLAPEAFHPGSVVPVKTDIPRVDGDQPAPVLGSVTLPGSQPAPELQGKPEVRFLGYAWNAQMGLLFANGGAQATQGSLMAKHGVNLKWSRQDDNGKLQEALVAFATQLSQGNPNPDKGAHFVTIMGDGGASFLKGLNDTLKRLGPEYQAKVIGSCGFSQGEDKFMGPAEWKANPIASRGGFCAGVIRDGDWNIAQKWLGDNGLRTNPDEKTYDPDALNWVNASDYIDAAQKYITGYSEDRPVVHNGKKTGETKHITVDSLVTWTPGDVTAAEKKGGLVSIASTHEYSSQMPCVIIGIDKWMKNNRKTVEGMLQAIGEGGEQVAGNAAALHRAAEISAQVYKESGADAAFWEKYYKGIQEKDKTGVMVELGGSKASSLSGDLLTFGLVPGSANVFAATYKVFGDIDVAQYPKLMPNYPPVAQILDTSYLQAVAKQNAPAVAQTKEKPQYSTVGKKRIVSKKAWHIQFTSGHSDLTAQGKHDLEKLKRDLLVASGTTIEIHGHTDSQGNPSANQTLSEARAFAVQKWLKSQSPVNFPDSRFKIFAHGQRIPVAPISTEAGRAQNRRVESVLLTSVASAP